MKRYKQVTIGEDFPPHGCSTRGKRREETYRGSAIGVPAPLPEGHWRPMKDPLRRARCSELADMVSVADGVPGEA